MRPRGNLRNIRRAARENTSTSERERAPAPGVCYRETGRCLKCGAVDHWIHDCLQVAPRQGFGNEPRGPYNVALGQGALPTGRDVRQQPLQT